ncbi:hypothetical protein [Sphingobacterium sp. MYb388]|uniref:hypothetical protein n=1 Tax=Sphingobacterium sp. MYb388 TaxID=2745437 RepID=UPI0030AA2D74
MIIERNTGIYTMENTTAEVIATSRLTEFVPLLFKAMNETGGGRRYFKVTPSYIKNNEKILIERYKNFINFYIFDN